MTWARGRDQVERLLADGAPAQVEPSSDVADRLLRDADAHLRLAGRGIEEDPAGALQLAFDAARKATAALLAVQGLRATARGGHVALLRAARAQFDPQDGSSIFRRVDRLRRRRNDTEYPSSTSPGVTTDEAARAIATAGDAVDTARQLLAADRLGPFR